MTRIWWCASDSPSNAPSMVSSSSLAAAAAVRVDARVARDLVDPRLEGDRPLSRAHAPQRGDEDLLGDVLRPAVVLHEPEHERGDAALVAGVEELERAVVAAPRAAHELAFAQPFADLCRRDPRRPHSLQRALPDEPTVRFSLTDRPEFQTQRTRMPAVADVIAYLDDLLRIGEFEDLGPNGLQVPAGREVE